MSKTEYITLELLNKNKLFCKPWDCYDYVMENYSVTDEECKCIVKKVCHETI